MKKIYVLMCGGFRGSGVYDAREAAEAQAERMRNISGQNWRVVELLVRA